MRHTRIIVTHYGGPDALQVLEEECPEPKGGEVRVRVLAAGISLPDVMAREGVHPETPRVPFTPGWDLVGVVGRLGAGVAREGGRDRQDRARAPRVVARIRRVVTTP
jgi:NADPH:quinone reductase-like Zn-dependent oxidoreductase